MNCVPKGQILGCMLIIVLVCAGEGSLWLLINKQNVQHCVYPPFYIDGGKKEVTLHLLLVPCPSNTEYCSWKL